MSKNGKLIFKNFDPYVTSKFGYRDAIYKNGKLISKAGGHDGVDYGTNGKKLAQYAIEDGKVLACGTDSTKAKFVYVYYPRLAMVGLHYHLDSYKVKKGQKVTAETILGYTGTTGNSTGIHLHYGWFPYSNWGKAWKNRGWLDFEKYEYVAPVKEEPKEEPKAPVIEKTEEPKAPIVEKTIDELAQEVLDGKHGNGAERIKSLGDNYNAVQKRVNEMLHEQRAEAKPVVDTIKVGDKVKVTSRKDYNDHTNDKWVLKAQFRVKEIAGDRVVITRNGAVTGAWDMKDLKKV